jgi:hypothetical protein
MPLGGIGFEPGFWRSDLVLSIWWRVLGGGCHTESCLYITADRARVPALVYRWVIAVSGSRLQRVALGLALRLNCPCFELV